MKRICILYYAAGAGHRATATALYNELQKQANIQVELFNFIDTFQLKGFKNSSRNYKFTIKYLAKLQGVVVKLVDQKLPCKLMMQAYDKAAKKHYATFLKEHPADIYISTGYFDNALFDYLKLNAPKAKTIMTVTDIVHPLRIWFNANRDLTILPSQEIYDKGLKYFNHFKDKVTVMGLPISPVFYEHRAISDLRKELNIPDQPTILVSGGGEGLDSVPKIVSELDKQLSNVNICVICGKDQKQLLRMSATHYKNRVIPLGWTNQFAEYLLASDLILTKAGATTVWEAMTAKKKTIIFGKIHGQEDGNTEFAKKYFKAEFNSKPKQIAKLAADMLTAEILIPEHHYMKNWTKEIASLLINLLD